MVDQPLFRGANADLNLTFAMALIFSLVGSCGRCRSLVRSDSQKSCLDRRVTQPDF